ncbi:uncharacterized protein LOC119470712 [Cebus imitator]|uniref:uncharacterized protein LOC119470712 n=1 Tax=Cebus imitator TaxID=2715852 RepID=UPI0018997F78|nr:uncharacterized protein LOC119470712 [Cebus imitator]
MKICVGGKVGWSRAPASTWIKSSTGDFQTEPLITITVCSDGGAAPQSRRRDLPGPSPAAQPRSPPSGPPGRDRDLRECASAAGLAPSPERTSSSWSAAAAASSLTPRRGTRLRHRRKTTCLCSRTLGVLFTFSCGRWPAGAAGYPRRGWGLRHRPPGGVSVREPGCGWWLPSAFKRSALQTSDRPPTLGIPSCSYRPSTCSPNHKTQLQALGLAGLQLRNVLPRADRCTAGTGRKATSVCLEGLKDFARPSRPFHYYHQEPEKLLRSL